MAAAPTTAERVARVRALVPGGYVGRTDKDGSMCIIRLARTGGYEVVATWVTEGGYDDDWGGGCCVLGADGIAHAHAQATYSTPEAAVSAYEEARRAWNARQVVKLRQEA